MLIKLWTFRKPKFYLRSFLSLPPIFRLAYLSYHTISSTRVLIGGRETFRLEAKKILCTGKNKNAMKMCREVSTQSSQASYRCSLPTRWCWGRGATDTVKRQAFLTLGGVLSRAQGGDRKLMPVTAFITSNSTRSPGRARHGEARQSYLVRGAPGLN